MSSIRMPVFPSSASCAMPMVRSTLGWCRRIVSSNSFRSSCSAAGLVASRRLLMAHGVELYTASRTSPKLPAPSLSFRIRSFQLTRLTTCIELPMMLDISVPLPFGGGERGGFDRDDCERFKEIGFSSLSASGF